ncbi:MAG TPA: hypothetical protein VFQ44_31055 [Streptosporangiaceae bacterium]|nr:hypothetical protein [Streptosporangiaceae bacterium]
MDLTASDGPAIRLHRLTMVAEDDGVMVGRPDVGSYALFPEEGAQALRLLDSGMSVPCLAAWYEQECGSSLDVDDFLAALADLRFVCAEGEERHETTQVRWQRLGKWMFSWPAWLCYFALLTAAVAEIAREPALLPAYHQVFFTRYISLIPLTLAAAQIPCILLHESFHALAGRRLGLPSTLRLGRRLYYLVAETRLPALLSVPRRQRYLPFLAGILADAMLFSALTLLAAVLRGHAIPAWCPALCLAVAFTCVLRLIWQFMLYLETDLYYVVATALRCSDLQNATRFQIKTQFRRLLGRGAPRQATEWSDHDRAMARWYAPLLIAGYGFSLGTLAWAGIPATARFVSLIVSGLDGQRAGMGAFLDATTFLGLTALQAGLTIYVIVRDRRARTRTVSSSGSIT